MVIGFVLISTIAGKEHDVYASLIDMKEIIELHPLFGEYDIIAKIETENFDDLGKIVVENIRTINGVLNTKTLAGTKF
jgi:DNA-binding Lrp family transcriptional regulator